MECHICETKLDLRYQLGREVERFDGKTVVEIQVEWSCNTYDGGCGFYRIVGLSDYLVPKTGPPWMRLDDFVQEESK